MIFVTIGTQEPFDRLIETIDEIAPNLGERVIAQISGSKLQFKNIETIEFLDPEEFNRYFDEASLIVSHAGMGSIISALQKGKPILIFPRLAEYHEHRNDHQLATLHQFRRFGYVHTALNREELIDLLKKHSQLALPVLHSLSTKASSELLNALRLGIDNI